MAETTTTTIRIPAADGSGSFVKGFGMSFAPPKVGAVGILGLQAGEDVNRRAAIAFRAAAIGGLTSAEIPYFLAAGDAAARLGREFADGWAGVRRLLDHESRNPRKVSESGSRSRCPYCRCC